MLHTIPLSDELLILTSIYLTFLDFVQLPNSLFCSTVWWYGSPSLRYRRRHLTSPPMIFWPSFDDINHVVELMVRCWISRTSFLTSSEFLVAGEVHHRHRRGQPAAQLIIFQPMKLDKWPLTLSMLNSLQSITRWHVATWWLNLFRSIREYMDQSKNF